VPEKFKENGMIFNYTSYIMPAYSKFLEANGARVVPIINGGSRDQIRE